MVRALSEIGRVLLRFDTSLVRHAEPLGLFLEALASPAFFGKSFSKVAARIESERAHAEALVSSFRAVAKELRETNNSLLSTAQSEVMKIFTGITVAVLPLNFIAAALTIPAEHTPILGTHFDFWIVVIIMAIVEVFVLAFLRLKKWI